MGLLLRCDGCQKWTVKRVTRYGDGSEVVNWKAPDGKGRCGVLDIDTAGDFGCTSFEAAAASDAPHVVGNWKNGAPWQHHASGPCPDCRGRGSDTGVCRRCAGTGKVRYYDDGFIGEEQTRLHPKEKETAEPLKCWKCATLVVDLKWIHCPVCGARLETPMETENVDGLGNAGGDFKPDNEERAADLGADIADMNDRDAKMAAMRRMTEENGCTADEAAAAKEMADRLEAMGR
jgi:hypothetical protein